jgi:predicted Zn-dependent protease
MALARIAASYAWAGQKEEARNLLEELRRLSRERYVSPYCIATVYMALRDVDRAMPYLEAAYRERSTGMVFLREAKNSEAYRASARFRKLVDRMRFHS